MASNGSSPCAPTTQRLSRVLESNIWWSYELKLIRSGFSYARAHELHWNRSQKVRDIWMATLRTLSLGKGLWNHLVYPRPMTLSGRIQLLVELKGMSKSLGVGIKMHQIMGLGWSLKWDGQWPHTRSWMHAIIVPYRPSSTYLHLTCSHGVL